MHHTADETHCPGEFHWAPLLRATWLAMLLAENDAPTIPIVIVPGFMSLAVGAATNALQVQAALQGRLIVASLWASGQDLEDYEAVLANTDQAGGHLHHFTEFLELNVSISSTSLPMQSWAWVQLYRAGIK